MKSLERRFNNIASENPNLHSIVCFYRAVIGQGFSGQTLGHWYQKLVDKDDYDKSCLKAIMDELKELTKTPEEKGK